MASDSFVSVAPVVALGANGADTSSLVPSLSPRMLYCVSIGFRRALLSGTVTLCTRVAAAFGVAHADCAAVAFGVVRAAVSTSGDDRWHRGEIRNKNFWQLREPMGRHVE